MATYEYDKIDNVECKDLPEQSAGISRSAIQNITIPDNFVNRKVSYFTITDIAKTKIIELLNGRPTKSSGVKVSIRSKGCSGLSYKIEFADYGVNLFDQDEMVEFESDDSKIIRIFIDTKASLFIIGTVMDYEVEQFKEGFIFKNPNEKGKCGCGSSFYV